MRFFKKLYLPVVVGALILIISTVALWAEDIKPEGAVAEVNGVAIARKDLDIEMKMVWDNIVRSGQQVDESMLNYLQGQILDNMIDAELIYQESQKKGIVIGDDAIEKAVNNFKQKFPSEAEYNQMLKDFDISPEVLRMQFKKGLASQEFIEKQIVGSVVISDEATRSFFDANPESFKSPEKARVSHILIPFDQDKDEARKTEAKKTIETIQKALQAGKDFSEIAKKFSKCPSGAKGGDIGYFERGQVDKAFEEAAFNLKPGEVSGIVETRFGFHLIRLEDIKPERNIPYEEAKEQIGAYLNKRETNQKIGEYLAKIKETAKIKKML